MEALQLFLQQLINGVQIGSVYALIAVGYTMVYGVLRFINFAHGDVYMLGAYLGFYAVTTLFRHQPPLLAGLGGLAVCMAGSGILGVVIERTAYRPVRRSGRLAALITAIGVSLLLENASQAALGSTPRAYQIAGIGAPLNVALGGQST